MSETITPGALVTLDPADKRVFVFDWDAENLGTGVQISTWTHTITVIRQIGVTALTKDNESLLVGNRKTQLRLDATTATAGDRYRVDGKMTTNEAPPQTKERGFFVLIQNR